MHVVVNHLHLRDPPTDATANAAREAVQLVVDTGADRLSAARILMLTTLNVACFMGRATGAEPAR